MIYGALKDKYVPDVIHRPIGAAKLLDYVNNKDFLPPVRTQGELQACVGYSVGAQLAGKAMKLGVYSEWFSPKWIWNGARFIQGWLNQNCGVYPRDAFDWLKDKGSLLEHFWGFGLIPTFDASTPPSSLYPEAEKYPIIDRRRVTGNQDDICSAIQTHDFVSIGTPWFPQWETCFGTLSTPTKAWTLPEGNWHETLLYGFDRAKGMFFGMNSWGPLWGKGGHFEMPFEAFDAFSSFGGWDCMYATVSKWPAEPKVCWLKRLPSIICGSGNGRPGRV